MAVKETKPKYESRGREFDKRSDAERFEAVTEAREKLEAAQRRFQKVLAESAKTADGVPFEFGVFCDYWYVRETNYTMPSLQRLSYICWSWSVDEDGETIRIREDMTNGERGNYIPINKLYRIEKNARDALRIAQRQWLDMMVAEYEGRKHTI